jgi:DNA-binding transcriptional LysR family regulator
MPRLSLTNLETFCCVARLGTFSAAAERLHTTQPGISARIRELETSLGVKLFHRRGRNVELTVQGRSLIRKAEPVLMRVDELLAMAEGVGHATGIVRLGLGDLTIGRFAPLIASLRKEMPGVTFEIEMDLAVHLQQRLALRRLDLIVIAGQLESVDLITAPLGGTRLLWLAAAPGKRGGEKRLQREQLLSERSIWITARPSPFNTLAMNTLRSVGANLENVNTCDRISTLAELVLQCEGVGLLPESLVGEHLRAGRLVPVPNMDPVPVTFTIACHRDADQPVVRYVMDAALQSENGGASHARRAARG